MANEQPVTVTVEDSQVFPDAQSQHDMDLEEPVKAAVNQCPGDDVQDGNGDKTEQKKAAEDSQEQEKPAEQNPDPENRGDVPAGVGEQFKVEDTQIVEDDDDSNMTMCRKCHIAIELHDAVARGPDHVWCRSCNSIYTCLQRHQAFPPKSFAELTEQQQVGFWRKCKEQKEGKTFRYTSLRNLLINKLVEETVKLRRLSVGGTYEPKGVLMKQGYDVSDEVLADMPKKWNSTLRDWTYLLVKTSISEETVFKTIESQIVEAERLVKKKRPAEVKNEPANATSGAASESAIVHGLGFR